MNGGGFGGGRSAMGMVEAPHSRLWVIFHMEGTRAFCCIARQPCGKLRVMRSLACSEDGSAAGSRSHWIGKDGHPGKAIFSPA